jgi:hypothetical protein
VGNASSRYRFRRRSAPGWLSSGELRLSLTLALLSSALVASATGLKGSVQVGGTAVEAEPLETALDLCARHEPDRPTEECIDTFWVPRWLLDREAQKIQLAQTPQMRGAIADILHRNLVKKLSDEDNKLSDRNVDEYLNKNRRDFEKPLRLRLFRILLNSKTEAEELRRTLTKDTTIDEFRKIAREKSVDRATHERGGDLGFVWPDGSTDVPQVRVEVSLYEAALSLSDGEIAPQIVPEDGRFAIIWRRGMKPQVPLNDESRRTARLRLLEQKREFATARLLDELKAAHVRERTDVLLGKLRRTEARLFQDP